MVCLLHAVWIAVVELPALTSSKPLIKNTQEKVLDIWQSILPSLGTFARLEKRKSNPQNTFFGLIDALQTIFADDQEPLNVLVIGASDGTHDEFIQKFYMDFPIWNGLFIEPIVYNFHDLEIFLRESIEQGRTHVLRGAVYSECSQPTITMKTPIFEELNKSEPHWKRRQIAQVIDPGNGTMSPMSIFWKLEQVRCLTVSQLLFHWRNVYLNSKLPSISKYVTIFIATCSYIDFRKPLNLRRFHVLRIDAEGSDIKVS